ncbi:MAG TPA: GntG family PLP-dependent aldolase [Rhodothermales bacterium]|nr:low specificity L-threonine aldolase [Bacteroidota bacterium]HRK74338.1 GntG family PLP-dependent aldolase [Rhodothermales bacterium]HRR08631.1 GntG family PLP-dependent aldolase [Rhodothermales bacterium]
MNTTIDLRSDTLTQPTQAMRAAMMNAPVGDDVFGEDPTVNQLQDTVATLLGKEAALFVSSGVMGNQLAIKLHSQPGDEVICDADCHIFNYESGAGAVLSGLQFQAISSNRGILSASQIEAAIRPGAYWEPQTRVVALENTHNKAGGVVYPLEKIHAIANVVQNHHLAFHLDGARLWNASIATGLPEATYAAPFDTVCVCLSKGLGAPVGSVLVGRKELIEKARRYRKMWGGGMRQVGFLAAAGLYALEHHRERLAEDHRLAKKLAEGLGELGTFDIEPEKTETNIVMFGTRNQPAKEILASLLKEGIKMVAFGSFTIRATTHIDISEGQIDKTLTIMKRLFT